MEIIRDAWKHLGKICKHKKYCRIATDIAMVILFLLLQIPSRILPVFMHELFGLLIILPVAVHIMLNRRWISTTLSNMFHGKTNRNSQYLFVLVIGLLIAFIVTIISGIALSRSLDGVILTHDSPVREKVLFPMIIHRTSSMVLVVIILLHVKVHWKYLKSIFIKRGKQNDEIT
jgi:hypothetical protein